MEWRKQHLFVEATANLIHEETDNKEDLDTHVHFPSCPRCPTHCKRVLWLISATKKFIPLFEKLLSVCQISWTLSIFRGSCKCSPVGVSPCLWLNSSSIIFWFLKVCSHLWKVLVIGCDFKLMDFICRIWQIEVTVFISHPFKGLLTKCLQRCMQSLCQGVYSCVADGLYRETMCRLEAHCSGNWCRRNDKMWVPWHI